MSSVTKSFQGPLRLFECQVPLSECNIQLGSRKKSLDTKAPATDLPVPASDVPAVAASIVLLLLQKGRPDTLLTAQVYRKVNEACRQAVQQLTSTSKDTYERQQIVRACKKVLDSSRIEAGITAKMPVHRIESFSATNAGTCDYQEDRAVRVGQLTLMTGGPLKDSGADYLIGVYDGHGGFQCSQFIVDRLWFEVGAQRQATPGEALKTAYEETDRKFNEVAEQEEWDAGSTALTCWVKGDQLWLANCGDCRAVLCKSGGEAVQLTTDHNVKNPKEVEDVVARGGTILLNRVNGVLSVTRALGNRPCRDLIAQSPEVSSYALSWKDEVFLVIGSDGLFDKLSNSDICSFVLSRKKQVDEELAEVRRQLSSSSNSCQDPAGLEKTDSSNALAMLGIPMDQLEDPAPELTLEQAEKLLKCSYQTIVDDLVQHAVKKSAGYCDNTTAVLLFFDMHNCLSAEEVAAASRVITQAQKNAGGNETQSEDADENPAYDPMETSMLVPPT